MATYLFVLLIIILVLVLGFIIVTKFFQKKLVRKYKKKGSYLLSPGEARFFDALSHVITEDMYICPKVRIADMLDVTVEKTDPNFWPYLNAINQKHVDFVICRKSDFAPLLVIELDGGSHNEKARTERDRIVDQAFADAEIPILHVPVVGFYEYKSLREKIMTAIKK